MFLIKMIVIWKFFFAYSFCNLSFLQLVFLFCLFILVFSCSFFAQSLNMRELIGNINHNVLLNGDQIKGVKIGLFNRRGWMMLVCKKLSLSLVRPSQIAFLNSIWSLAHNGRLLIIVANLSYLVIVPYFLFDLLEYFH